MKHLRLLGAALALLALAGCAVGPDYVRPTWNLPAQYKENSQWQLARPMDASPQGPWWTVYGDSQLNALMDELNRQSPTLAAAEAQYRLAQAQLRQAESGLFPSLSATAGRTRGTQSSGSDSVSNQYSLGLAASWEIDLWGRVRRAVEAGQAKQAADLAQLQAVRLSSQAQLASAWLQLVVADRQLAQLQDSARTLAETLTLTRNQYRAGVVSDAAVVQAESQLKSAQAQVVDKQLTRAQLEHAIASALGKTPAELSLPSQATHEPHLPAIPPGIPSALLERRPDIAQAERNMAEANAQIGLAKAAFFPTLSLNASGGYKGASFANWVTQPNRFWSLGPSLALALFDAGLRKAQSDAAIAQYDQTVASYRQTVLAAFQSVEDNLAAQRLLSEEAELQQAAVTAARRSETITLNQYRAGTVSYINVMTAQANRLAAEKTAWDIRNRQYLASVNLITGIGGQW